MIKKISAKIFAQIIHKKHSKWIKNPLDAQQNTFNYLIEKARNTDFGKEILEMAEQEEIHKSKFDELIVSENVKPTIMFPLWNLAGYALGFGTALLGKKAAMACTVAVEEVIGQHYEEQAEELKKRKIKPDLLKTVKKFREDELEHHDTGVEHHAEMTTGYVILSKTIKQLCYTAIKISKKY